MKKLFLFFGMMVVTVTTFAQRRTRQTETNTAIAPITYEAILGVNFSQISYTGSGVSNQFLPGFEVGGAVDFNFQSFTIQPALLFSTKGGKTMSTFSDGEASGTDNAKVTLDYLVLPINFIYYIPAGNGKVFVGAGPYFAYGLSGKDSNDLLVTGQDPVHTNDNITFGSAQGDIKAFDFGFSALAGYQFNNNISVNAGTQIGLANLSNAGAQFKTNYQSRSVELGFRYQW